MEGGENEGERSGREIDRKRGRKNEREKKKKTKKFARSIFLSQLQCVEGFSDNPADKVHNSEFEGFSF